MEMHQPNAHVTSDLLWANRLYFLRSCRLQMMPPLHLLHLTNQWNTEHAPFNHKSTNYLAF